MYRIGRHTNLIVIRFRLNPAACDTKPGFFFYTLQATTTLYLFMRFKKAKPLHVKNMQEALLGELYPDKILYVCKMRVLDRVIFAKQSPEYKFDEEWADKYEINNSFFYFVVWNDLRYGTLPAYVFQPWLAFLPEAPAPGAVFFANEPPTHAGAKDCFYKYINFCLNN